MPSVLRTEAELDDRREVLKARDMLEKRGLLGTYSTPQDFAEQAERHLIRLARSL